MIAGALLLMLIAAGWLSLPKYRVWKLGRFQRQAREFLQNTNLNAAWLASQQALILNSSNVESLRIAGDIAATANLPQAVGLRRKVAELEPGNTTNGLLWAQTALAFEKAPFTETVRALEGIPAEKRASPEFHFLAAGLDLKRGNADGAEQHFVKALEFSPTNAQARINLAVLRLRSTNQVVRGEAQRILEEMRTSPTIGEARVSVLRSLVGYCRNSGDLAKAVSYSTELIGEKEAVLQDKLLHAEVLKVAGNTEFAKYLANVQSVAAGKAPEVALVLAWMRENELIDAAFAWFKTLPKEVQAEMPVPMTIAELYAAKKDWPGLQSYLHDQDWKDRENIRHALVAFAMRNSGDRETSEARWKRAVLASENQSHSLAALAQLASSWGWNKEFEDLLMTIVTQHPAERWASDLLLQEYFRAGNTAGLRKIFSALAEVNSKDLASRNNYAVTSLLLKDTIPADDLKKAHEFAKQIYDTESTNSSFASTYAYSLHLQGKSPESLALFQKLNDKELSDPSTAVYYGVVLAATGDREKAIKALEIGAKASPLPEERKMAKAELEKIR